MLNLFAVLAAAAATAAASPEPCGIDKTPLLALSAEKFDQDPKGGWRILAERPGCDGAAADLIAEYRRVHWGQLAPYDLHLNYWHEGQARAYAGQTDRAVRLLLDGANPDSIGYFEDYALGTVAFLLRDMEGLKAARARLAARPEPPEFKARVGADVPWPPNLDVLDGLIACFEKPYKAAYGEPACRQPSKR